MKTFTPSITAGSTLTWRCSRHAGRFFMVAAAPASASAFHSSPVFGRRSQFARSGPATIFCICGLTVVGTGKMRAGTSRGAGSGLCANAAGDGTAKPRHRSPRPADLPQGSVPQDAEGRA